MKTLKDFTPKIKARIPEYINKALDGVFDGGRFASFDPEKAEAAVNWNYEKCGYKRPVIIVAENIYEQQIYFNHLKANKNLHPLLLAIYNLKNGIELPIIEISQLDSQLNNQLYNQLYNQLNNQLYSQLRSQLDSQLDSQLRSQLGSQLGSQLDSQLRSQLDIQLYSQLNSQLNRQLNSQLRDQLYSQLSIQLESQIKKD